ncbi:MULTISPECIES: hypothetical protein [Streptomyces]|uniref:hypothetical protein n=1 Tax=Streptomyces TaxID=1883 RepID=UPI001E619FA4|nr:MULTISPECIES: hypothetical protein [Streptomyces]UFQ18917.1 hypothetical protein J2N69_30250 [Streptomyces huasconensis]WCL88536.1 hypothetical protein PPN52_30215 [Streptomyces sp. JCM 35825]
MACQPDLLLAHPITRTGLVLHRFGALATGRGACLGPSCRPAIVLTVTAAIRVLEYGAHTFATQLSTGWLANLSLFHYYSGREPLKYGFQ